jgi:hypothetical protein
VVTNAHFEGLREPLYNTDGNVCPKKVLKSENVFLEGQFNHYALFQLSIMRFHNHQIDNILIGENSNFELSRVL